MTFGPYERTYANSIADATIKMRMIEYTLWPQMQFHLKFIQ